MYFTEDRDTSLLFALWARSLLLLYFKVAGKQIKKLQQGHVINYSYHEYQFVEELIWE